MLTRCKNQTERMSNYLCPSFALAGHKPSVQNPREKFLFTSHSSFLVRFELKSGGWWLKFNDFPEK